MARSYDGIITRFLSYLPPFLFFTFPRRRSFTPLSPNRIPPPPLLPGSVQTRRSVQSTQRGAARVYGVSCRLTTGKPPPVGAPRGEGTRNERLCRPAGEAERGVSIGLDKARRQGGRARGPRYDLYTYFLASNDTGTAARSRRRLDYCPARHFNLLHRASLSRVIEAESDF